MLVLHALRKPVLLVLLSYLALCTTATPLPSSLTPRQEYCSNAPSTKAGTPLAARSLPPLSPRRDASTILWCAPGSSTSIRLRMLSAIAYPPQPNPIVASMLTLTYSIVMMNVNEHDGVIPLSQAVDGVRMWIMHGGLTLRTWNTNNHQMTWGVLGAGLQALVLYMQTSGYGQVKFTVWDGVNEVGAGELS